MKFSGYLNSILFIACVSLPQNSFSIEIESFTGEVKAQYQYSEYADSSITSTLGDNTLSESLLDLRLKSSIIHNNWQATAHYQINTITGSAVEANKQLFTNLPIITSQLNNQLFDLSHTISEDENSFTQQNIDRLFISYSTDKSVIKFGRQALSWGNGIVFHPMDLFNPFSPDAIDTSYKRGTDMLYTQWLFDSGSDASFLLVPRRNFITNKLDSSESSIAGKWHIFKSQLEINILVAEDYDEKVIGLGISGPIADAIWRTDIVPVFLDNNTSKTSAVVNAEYTWQCLNKNIHGYIEYFRNGFGGTEKNITLDNLSDTLTRRLTRLQAFNTSRDYLSVGARIEQSALINFMPLLIHNINDHSLLALLQGIYSSSQNSRIEFGLSIGTGQKGTEFSGLETARNSAVYLQTPKQAHIRYSYYF